MPVFNADKYLREAIDSILSQTFTDFEFIIINDGSTDGTKDIILSYDDPRIVYLENEKNSGIVVTLNKGLDAARGTYIARMDADDISLPERFAEQIKFLEDHPDIIICGTDTEDFGEGIVPSIFTQVYDPDLCSAGLIFNPCFGHPTVMWRASIMHDHNLRYDEDCRGFEDFRLWWEFAKYCRLSNLDRPLLRYRKHPEQVTKNENETTQVALRNFTRIRLELLGIEHNEKAVLLFDNYRRGAFSEFSEKEINEFIDLLLIISRNQNLPLKTSKNAIRITGSKAVAYILSKNGMKKSRRIAILTRAYMTGLMPLVWYIKYMRYTIL